MGVAADDEDLDKGRTFLAQKEQRSFDQSIGKFGFCGDPIGFRLRLVCSTSCRQLASSN